MNTVADISGLVLVGGKSERMGSPKAYLHFGPKPQWQACEALLTPFCSSVYFSVSKQLYPPLPVPTNQLIEDSFAVPIGPLGGIISAFTAHPTRPFLVLACDLPYFDAEAVELLCAQRDGSKKATVFVHEDKIEPLCALYEPSILSDLFFALEKNLRCPRKILSELEVKKIRVPKAQWLINCNSPHERAATRKTVTVYYYASLREQRRVSQEQLVTHASSMFALFEELKEKFGFSIDASLLRYAKNNRLVAHDEPIGDGDELLFIPPVSGG